MSKMLRKRLILVIAVLLLVYNGAQNHFKEYAGQPTQKSMGLICLSFDRS